MSHSAALPLKLCSVTALVLLAAAGPAWAQQAGAPQVAVPVVQAVPQKSAGMRLNDALNQLARNSQDIAALGEAGQASLELGDAQAAIGFYRRALTIQPGNARLKAGLAGAYVLSEDPFTAIDLFDEAEKAGPIDPARLADRGLAFDLVGDAQTAQTYYRQSLAAAPSDETLRRMGLSQAILRDRKGMDATLAPLLQKQDKAAWRTRAFGLAILGQAEQAEAIAYQTMPADMAAAITAYLRYMPRLTAAQQAAAGNLGRFPRASEIGSDDPRMAAYSRSKAQVAVAAPVAPAPTGKGKRDAKGGKNQPARTLAAVPPPEPQVSRETATASRPAIAPQPQPVAKPVPVQAAATPPAPVAAQPALAARETVVAKPASFDLARVASPAPAPAPSPAPAPAPAPAAQAQVAAAPQPAPAPRKPASLDEAFADLAPPSSVIEPQAGAVDVRAVRPVTLARKEPPAKEAPAKEPAAKDKPADPKAKDAKAKDPKAKDAKDPKAKDAKDAKTKPSHPSRIWVQIAAGRNKPALAFDWRKFAKEDPAVFKAQKPYVTSWGQTNRLLTGPFASAKEADAFVARLKKAGRDGAFAWTSPAGQVVDALGGGN